MAFVGIFSAGIPSSIIGKPNISATYKDSIKPIGDLQAVSRDFRATGLRMRIGVKKTKDSNGIR